MSPVAQLWTAGATLLLALVGAVHLLLGQRRLPLARRRYRADEPTSALSHAAEATTGVAARLLGEREGPAAEALRLAGLRLRPQDFVVFVGCVTVVLFAVGLVLQGLLLGVLLMLLGPVLAWLALRVLTGRRRDAFAKQFDETLQMLAGSLRAGYSLPQAAATVATEASSPTTDEFARIINEARVGRPLVEAMEDAARRVKSDDFFWVVQAIAINREVGGNLADVLDGVGVTIRERIHLKRQVSALAAEGKLSAIILCALPPLMLLAMSVLNPTYFGRFGESPLGIAMLVVGAIMMAVGVIWMRSMVNIKF